MGLTAYIGELPADVGQVIAERTARFNTIAGPRPGDFVDGPGGTIGRVARVDGEIAYLSEAGNYYLEPAGVTATGSVGCTARHGALTRLSGQGRGGRVWIFPDGSPGGPLVLAVVPFRVYRYQPGDNSSD